MWNKREEVLFFLLFPYASRFSRKFSTFFIYLYFCCLIAIYSLNNKQLWNQTTMTTMCWSWKTALR